MNAGVGDQEHTHIHTQGSSLEPGQLQAGGTKNRGLKHVTEAC